MYKPRRLTESHIKRNKATKKRYFNIKGLMLMVHSLSVCSECNVKHCNADCKNLLKVKGLS